MIKNFRDIFALLVGVAVFPTLWALQGWGVFKIPESIIGATIVIETMIAQFYFRRATAEEENPTSTILTR